MPETDLLFVDSWHVYARTSRELAALHGRVRWRIVLHDTTVDEWLGESLRMGMDFVEQARRTGYPISEITLGVWPAIEEFLAAHASERCLAFRRTSCNRAHGPEKGRTRCETRVIPATVSRHQFPVFVDLI